MSQAFHLLKKDLRALGLPLLLLYIVLLVQTALILRDPLTYDPLSGLPMVQLLFPLASLVTAAMVVHQEPLVGTTAFWMTRPIRRGALLLSKALFLLVFVVTPSTLATLGILLAYGMDSGPAGSALGGFLASMGVLLMGAVLVASVTPNVPTYLTAWISLMLTSALLNDFLERAGATRILLPPTAGAIGVFLFSAALIFHQYFTRRTRRTLIGLGVAYLGVPLLITLLSGVWARGPFENPDVPPVGPVAVGLGATLPSGVFPASLQVGSEATFSAIPEILKAPPGLDVAIHAVHGDLWADGSAYAQVRFNNTTVHFDCGAIEAAMPGFRWIGKPRSPEAVSFSLTLAGDSAFDDLVGKPATTLLAVASGELYAYRLAGAIPLVSGARFENGTRAAVIGSISRRPSSVQLDLRTRHIMTPVDTRFPRILLVNRRREEMLEGDRYDPLNRGHRVSLFSGATIHASEQRLTFPSSANRDRVNLDDEWLREAELAFLESVPAGHFRTRIEVNDFRMVDTTITPNAISSGAAQ
jgi:hypothetical protein